MKKVVPATHGLIKKGVVPNPEILFSFKYFDSSDAELCPPVFHTHYTQVLMERLKALSAWTLNDFMNTRSKSIRAHTHDWEYTSRPDGFKHLNEQLRSYSGWQFQLSGNEHGRVHGFFINYIFHIVWLDKDHRLYP